MKGLEAHTRKLVKNPSMKLETLVINVRNILVLFGDNTRKSGGLTLQEEKVDHNNRKFCDDDFRFH